MRTSRIITAIALGTGLVAAGIGIPSALAQRNTDRGADDAATWLSIPQIHDKVTAGGYRDIMKIERERNAYEVKATDREGRAVKLVLDPQSGDVIRTRTRAERDAARDDDDNARRMRDAGRDRDRDADRASDRGSDRDGGRAAGSDDDRDSDRTDRASDRDSDRDSDRRSTRRIERDAPTGQGRAALVS